ncbi:DUF1697 domain-containing protein [soil metagenome]
MQYVALLRGINVGGNAKVSMATLKGTFEALGFEGVKTYINSGNVIFSTSRKDAGVFCGEIEAAITKDFGFSVPVLLRSQTYLKEIAGKIPETWQNNTEVKTDVLFLWEGVDSPTVLEQLRIVKGVDEVAYYPGALVWHVSRGSQSRSGLSDVVGTKLYKQMTIRNVNTLRKLVALMEG